MSRKKINNQKKVTILNWPPREGKTHASLEWIIKNDPSFVSLVHNHGLAKHQLNMIQDKFGDSLTIVHLVGKSKACRYDNITSCSGCEFHKKSYNLPDGFFKNFVSLRGVNSIMDLDVVEEMYPSKCPYHMLKQFAEVADGVITVPQLFNNVETRDTLLIDEEVTLDYFYPPVSLVGHFQERYGEQQTRFHIQSYQPQIQQIKDNMQEEKEDNTPNSKYKVVFQACEILTKVIEHTKGKNMSVDEFVRYLKNKNWTVRKKSVFDEDIFELVRKIGLKYNHDGRHIDDLLLATIYHGGVYKQPTFQGGSKTYLIGKGGKQFYCDKFKDFDKIVLVGDLEAKRFAKKITNDESEIQVSEVTDFKYRDNFIVLFVRGNRKDHLTSQQKIILDLAIRLAKRKIKFLIFTGSKEKAEKIRSHDDQLRRIITDGADKKDDIDDYIDSNLQIIAYLNSRLTRGVDVPDLHITLLHSAGFSRPLYEYLKKGKTNDKLRELGKKHLEYILSNETTNAVMRISPIRGKKEDYPKIIVVPEYYVDRIDYLPPPIRVSGEEAFRVLRASKKITDSYESGENDLKSSSEAEKSASKSLNNKGGNKVVKKVKEKIPEKIFQENLDDFKEIREEATLFLRENKERSSTSFRKKVKSLVRTNDDVLISRSLSILYKLGYFSKRREGRKVYWGLNDDNCKD